MILGMSEETENKSVADSVNDGPDAGAAEKAEKSRKEDRKTVQSDAVEAVETPAVAVEPAATVTTAPAPSAHVVTPGASTDTVYLSRCVYKNMHARKSLTVHHLQRRLAELGFRDAYSDKDGWYGDLTMKAVKEYQESKGMNPTGLADADTFAAVFAGDRAVTVNFVD